jgi:MFS family permease
MVLYGLAGSSGAFAISMNEILIGRIFLGVANAGVMTACQALVADYFQGAAREQFSGRQGAAMALGGVVFLTSGGFLASLDWQYPFFIYLSSLVLLPLAFFRLQDRPRPVVASGAAAEAMPWGFVLGVASLAAFGMMTFYMIPVKFPFYLREMGVESPLFAGMAVASCTVTSAAVSMYFGRIKARFSPEAVFAIAFGIMGIGYAVVAFAGSAPVAVAGVAFAGLGLGLLMPNQVIWLMSRTPASARGRAAGIMTTAVFLGQFVSPLVSGPLSGLFGLGAVYGMAAGALALVGLMMAVRARAVAA